MEDRKVYHLINGEFVHDGMPSVHIPNFEELSAHIAILTDVGFFDDPTIAESVPVWSGISNGKRSDAVQASVFDMIHAEIMDERMSEKMRNRKHYNAEMLEKCRSMNYRNRSGKSYEELPKSYRNSDKGLRGIGRCGDRREERDCKAYCSMQSHMHRLDVNAEKSVMNDYDAEIRPYAEHRVGYNTVERIMYNADKRMREIRAEMAEKNHGYDDEEFVVETYDDSYVVRCGDGGFQFPYPDEYYNEKATWEGYEYMIRKYGMEYANKYAKGEI